MTEITKFKDYASFDDFLRKNTKGELNFHKYMSLVDRTYKLYKENGVFAKSPQLLEYFLNNIDFTKFREIMGDRTLEKLFDRSINWEFDTDINWHYLHHKWGTMISEEIDRDCEFRVDMGFLSDHYKLIEEYPLKNIQKPIQGFTEDLL